jgi:HEAT repeat protein
VRAAVAQAIAALALRPERPLPPLAIDGFERRVLAEADLARHKDALTGAGVAGLVPRLADARAIVRANAATAVGTLGPAAAGQAITVAALLRDDDDRVRIAAAHALDQLGDDAVVAAAPALVGALRGDAGLAEVCRGVLAARKGRVEAALVAGLETPDQTHGMRIADLIVALPNARDLLFAAFDGEAQNVQINAAFGVAKLGAKRAGPEGRQRLLNGLPGPPTRRRDAMLKALAMLGESPAS